MRRPISLILMALGLVVALIGVAKLTLFAPPETVQATMPSDLKAAPALLIDEGAGRVESQGESGPVTGSITIESSGPFRVVMGRSDDVRAWLGKGAANVASKLNEGDKTFQVQRTGSEDQIPDPAGSDLWISDEQHSGSWTSQWKAPAEGDWTVMVTRDGKASAPTNVTATWDNPDATWPARWSSVVWFFVAGVVLVALGLLVLATSPRRPTGRRAAVAPAPARRGTRGEGDGRRRGGATGAAAVPSSREVPQEQEPGAVADPRTGDAGAQQTDSFAGIDDPLAAPRTGGDTDETVYYPKAPAADAAPQPEHSRADHTAWVGEDDSFDDDEPPFGSGSGPAEGPRGAQAADGTPGEDSDRQGGRAQRTQASPRRRAWIAGATALGLLVPAGPAWADSESPAPSSGQQVEQLLPVLQQDQMERIVKDVAAVSADGMKKKDLKRLRARFDGEALSLRKDYFEAMKKKVKFDEATMPTISADPILSSAVTTTNSWPRQVMVVTKGKNEAQPVAVTLEQKSPRSQYKVTQAVPMVPNAKVNAVALGDPDVATIGPNASGLKASPQKAADGIADVMGNAKSKFASQVDSSWLIDAVRKNADGSKKALQKSDKKAKFKADFTVDKDSVRALRVSDGAFVSAYVTEKMTFTPGKDGKLEGLPKDVQAFVKTDSTDKALTVTYRIPVYFKVPSQKADGKINLVAGNSVMTGAKLK